jgi:integrase
MKGTVFRRGDSWTWAFSIPAPTESNPRRRRQVSKGGFARKRDAEAALAEALAEHGQAGPGRAEPSKMALARYLRDEWLPTCATLKPSTRNSYRFVVDTYLAPHVGDVRLCDLTAGQIVKMYDHLRTAGSTRAAKGGGRASGPLSESTVHKAHVVLGAALDHAVETGMLRTNPVLAVPKKNRPKQRSHSRPEMRTWTSEEARAFLEAAAGDRYAPIYDLDLNTGLRRGELAGLRWEDIDLDAAVLRVRRNRVSVDHDVHDGTPKGDRARTVDLDPGTVGMLRAHRRRQLKERLAWGEAWTDTGHVFTQEDGTALHPTTIGWHLRRLIRRAGVPSIRLHDLRHTHATLGLAAGVPAKVMQERLGHASVQITLDLYSHVVPGMQADAAARIGALLRG